MIRSFRHLAVGGFSYADQVGRSIALGQTVPSLGRGFSGLTPKARHGADSTLVKRPGSSGLGPGLSAEKQALGPQPLRTEKTAQKLHRQKPEMQEKAWAQRDLNPRPSDYESPALTAELWAHQAENKGV